LQEGESMQNLFIFILIMMMLMMATVVGNIIFIKKVYASLKKYNISEYFYFLKQGSINNPLNFFFRGKKFSIMFFLIDTLSLFYEIINYVRLSLFL